MNAERVVVHPASALAGELRVPGDKSISHRALIVGALADGPVTISGLAAGGDVKSTIEALRSLGADVEVRHDAAGRMAAEVSGPLREPDHVLDCGNSATTLRLLAGVVAGLDGVSVLSGDDSLRSRPVDRVVVPLRRMGAKLDARAGGTLPPLVVRGGALRGISYESPVPSAQVKSAVLLAGLRAETETSVTSPRRSRDHTERMLSHLGVGVRVEILPSGLERAMVEPGVPRARALSVPGDPSAAAFWMVAAALQRHAGAEVRLPGLCLNPTRLGAVTVLRDMGAEILVEEEGQLCGEPVGRLVVRGSSELRGGVVEGTAAVDALDELPVLALAGARSADGLVVRDAAELRLKETDRIAGTAALIRALGAEVDEQPDGMTVPGEQTLKGGVVDARGDHRLAMTAAVAGTLADGPVEIHGFGAVATSYPGFLDDLLWLGGVVER